MTKNWNHPLKRFFFVFFCSSVNRKSEDIFRFCGQIKKPRTLLWKQFLKKIAQCSKNVFFNIQKTQS